jgi:hypothetical protein
MGQPNKIYAPQRRCHLVDQYKKLGCTILIGTTEKMVLAGKNNKWEGL